MKPRQSLQRIRHYFQLSALEQGAKRRFSSLRKRLEVERLEDRTLLSVIIPTSNNNGNGYAALHFSQSGGYTPPDTQGAAGPTNFVETVNQEIAIFSPKATGASKVSLSLPSFYSSLPLVSSNSFFSDTVIIYDDNMPGLTPTTGRFIVGDLNVDNNTGGGAFDMAVSKSASPATLTSADWSFYQINITETNFSIDYPGNLGYNHDAFVFTINQFSNTTPTAHAEVVGVNATDLVNGVAQSQLLADTFKNDFTNDFGLRPATMHDAAAGGPMWLVSETGDGSHINVYKISNILSTFTPPAPTQLAVNSYSNIASFPPLQPDGSVVTSQIDSRILKVAEANNTLVATHAVAISSTQDAAQWYLINVSSGTPVMSQQGDVSLGNTTYAYYPGIDINSSGDVGLTFMDSGTATGKFMSMYVTARTPSDLTGQMETPVLVPAGTGVANYHDFAGINQRAGDLSGINVDPSDGTFWAVNEFANTDTNANWGTAIANFTIASGFSATLVGSTLQIQDNAGGANALIRLKAGDPTTLEVLNNGTVVASFSVASINNITVNLTGGSNQLTVDDTNGDPVPTGGLSYEGGPSNTLAVNYAADTGSRTITLDSTTPSGDTAFGTITGQAAGVISYEYADTSSATLTTGTGSDTITVNSTGAATTLVASASATVNIGNGNLSTLTGAVTVHGAGSTQINVNDQSSASINTYTVTASTVARAGFAGLTYSGTTSLTVSGGTPIGTDIYKILATASGTATTVNGGAANDTFTVGSATNSLNSIQGALTVNGGGGTGNKMNVNDQGSTAAHTYTLTASTLARTGAALITFTLIATTTVNGGSGGNSFVVALPVPTKTVTLNGGSGTNTLTGPNATNNWSITGTNAGTLDTKIKFSKMQNLIGGAGVDFFKISPAGKVVSINGGGAPLNQGDWLDYTPFTILQGPVSVNLATGSATNVNSGAAGAVSNIQNVHGGNGGNNLTGDSQGNILIGGTAPDTITGGTGRSILIGDKAPDTIMGSSGGSASGGDILIGGTTIWDSDTNAHFFALMSILAEWQSGNSYATRVSNLRSGGGLNGSNKLIWGTTVLDDGSANSLTAASSGPSTPAVDWFFAGTLDTMTNVESGEALNNGFAP